MEEIKLKEINKIVDGFKSYEDPFNSLGLDTGTDEAFQKEFLLIDKTPIYIVIINSSNHPAYSNRPAIYISYDDENYLGGVTNSI